jgi:tRNA(Ile)-lysidine synthase
LDSTVLLHLLRFTPRLSRGPLVVAHFDHGMRLGSTEDANWVKGLARGWGLPCSVERARVPPSSEAEARRLRYAFLHEARRARGARWILTAHHADDQAETVLFRVARGTGLRGLAGIPARRDPHVLRPLLSFWRSELEEYAESVGLQTRADPSNRAPTFARNRIRHRILPAIERDVAPGARRALCRLADHAREADRALSRLARRTAMDIIAKREPGEVVLSKSALATADPYLLTRALRSLVEELGLRLDAAATRRLEHGLRAGGPGTTLTIGGGLLASIDRDVVTLHGPTESPPDDTLAITASGEGTSRLGLGSRQLSVHWSESTPPDAQWTVRLHVRPDQYPLAVRAFSPGDRMRLHYGTKKLKKLFQEAGIPRLERTRRPLIVDRSGQILWVAGLAEASEASEVPGERTILYVGFTDVGER